MNIYVVDDTADIHTAIAMALRSKPAEIVSFLNPEHFIEQLNSLAPGVVLLDYHMKPMNGLEVQDFILKSASPLSIIFLSGIADVGHAVTAGRNGAVDFLRKPFKRAELLTCIENAERELPRLVKESVRRKQRQAVEKLTPRELDVLRELSEGLQSKQVAHRLGLSTRTVEAYRASITKKLHTSIASALLLANESGLLSAPPPFPRQDS